MKTITIQNLLLTLLTFSLSYPLYSQVSNDNRYNVFAQTTRYYFGPDAQDGTNYPTFLLHADMDTDGNNTRLINNDGTPFEHSVIKNADTPEDWSFNKKILGHLNQSSSYMDFTFYAFDNFCGDRTVVNSCCGFACLGKNDYETSRVFWSRRHLRSATPGSWFNSSLGDSSYRVYYRTAWRYYNGEWDRPLAFGTLGEGVTLFHTNYTNAAPSGVDVASYYGYLNDWSTSYNSAFSDSRDVTYSFVLNEPRVVTVSTNFTSTDYDSKIHIVRDNQNNTWDVLYSNDDIGGGNTKSEIKEVILQPGVYNVIVEGKGAASGRFHLMVRTHAVNLIAGNIEHSRPWIEPSCTLTMPISSTEDASVNFGTIAYSWESSDDGANSWSTIPFATNPSLTAEELGSLFLDTDIRRKVQAVGKTGYSDIISFAVASSKTNGEIRGKVTGPGGTPMSGVTIYAEIDPPNQGQCPGQLYETTTDGSGQYFLTDLYYGLNTASDTVPDVNFKVWPIFFTHNFNPGTHDVTLNTSVPIKTGYDFVDEEAVFIGGRVTQTDARSELETTCGVSDARFYLNDLLQSQFSNEFGEYDLPVISFGPNYVGVEYENHVFEPAVSETFQIFNDLEDVDFDDTTVNTVSGSVRACGGFAFGQVEILFQDEDGCFVFRDTTDNIGDFSLDLPARKYTMQVTNTDLDESELLENYDHNDIANYFAEDIIYVDLDTSDVDIQLQYRQTPEVSITGIDQNACGEYVIEQGQPITLSFLITEPNTFDCVVDTGLIKIVDAISGLENELIELPFKDGVAQYEIMPGEPKISGDFKLGFTATVYAAEAEELKTIESFEAIVVGNNPRDGAPFVTVSPEIPMMILRDPPGDASYAYLDQNQTSEFAYGFSALSGGSVNTWKSAKIGTDISIDGIGFGFNAANWGELTGSTTVGTYNSSQIEAVMSITNGIRYETSDDDDPNVMGQGGDIYIGAALNLHYSLTDIVEYNSSTCTVEQSVDVIIGSEAKPETQFRYTDYFIRTAVIPDLEFLMSQTDDQEERDDYQNQIESWNQTLQLNADLKMEATVIDTLSDDISWSGATNADMYTTSSSAINSSFEFKMEVNSEIAAEAGWEVAGSGTSGGVIVNMRMELGAGVSVSNMQERTTGFVLADSNADDGFNTKVKMCPTYNTPVFENVAGFTSCPHEEGTVPIDFPHLEIDNPVQVGIDPGGSAGFTFELTNLSQKQLTRSYFIDVIENSNPYGAIIDPGGAGFPLLISDVNYNQTVTRFFSVARNPSNNSDYSLEGIQFIAYPAECTDDISALTTSYSSISVYFNSPCSGLTINEPQDDWVHNSGSGQDLELHLVDYDQTAFNNIQIQYSNTGLNSWLDGITILPDDLNANASAGTFIDWNLTNVEDGEYDIRAKINCTGGINYTQRISGILDRKAPVVFGIPQPVDDHYDPVMNDEISVSFEEEISCQEVSAIITDLETDQVYATVVSCAGNTAIITPVNVLPTSIFRVSLNDVDDNYQNRREPYEWVFITGDYIYDPDCSPIEVSNNNLNQNAISQSTYQADQITSDGTVSFNTSIGFEAGESIDLTEGFEVELGGIFLAEIKECEN